MVHTRGGHTDPSASHEARPSASSPQNPFQASQALTVPSSEGRVPSSPPQRWTSGLGETSSQAPANSQAPEDIQRPSGIAPEVIIKRPMVTTPLIPGNSDYRAKPFHLSFTSTWRLCDSNLTFGIRLDCSKARGSREVQTVDLYISMKHGLHSIMRDFSYYIGSFHLGCS
ncbi:hypothetical protein CK203_115161 [Vitis vinifera]|uniref:Uncharacterized protein n=1 Tax=Vitis vinifera TaxID=29760 RepID=A0A438FCR6_VITVI|nr:hypothetical protein CK203_115161 [Vitis vinifera]